jgi:FkbM family methyltransferase
MVRNLLKRKFDKIVYSNPLLNQILRNVNKLLQPITSFRLRPYGVLTVKYKKVVFKMATNETSFVTKQLFWKGPKNFEYTPIFEKLVKKCACFLDIGANTGYYSLMAAKANPSILVHAFEPASGPYHFLANNITINNLQERVFIHKIALSNQKGNVEFFEILNPSDSLAEFNLSGVGGLRKTHETQENSRRTLVQSEMLDDFSMKFNINSVDLIKVDTEGTENLVLEGAAMIIDRFKPIIICETLFNKIEDKLQEIMKRHGYLFYNHVNGNLHQTDALIRRIDNGVSDCFFVHPERLELVNEFIADRK